MTRKKRASWIMVASAPAIGLALALAPNQSWRSVISLVAIFLISFLIFAWYYEDARERSFARGRVQDFGVAAAALVGFPVYLFRSRGAARGAIDTGLALLYYVLLNLLVLVGGVAGMLIRATAGMPFPSAV
jgi:hypothetical protein